MYNPITKCILPLSLAAGMAIAISSCNKKTETTTPSSTTNTPVKSALLKDEQKGKPFSTGFINDFVLASDNKSVALLAVNNATGRIYAIDLKDNDAKAATTNAIASPASDLVTKMAAALGTVAGNVAILNMEVNPISKSIYVLARNNATSTNMVLKITNGGTTVAPLDLNDVTYTSIQFSSNGDIVNDITWGGNALYISFSSTSILVGKLATISAPFTHNATMTNRMTTVYKTNWGGNYFTDAPLETMTFAQVAGVNRLMGITVCAPGFSFKTSEIAGTGLLQVKENFNLNTGFPLKVFPVFQGGKTFLIELHEDGRIVRVGEKYLDESQPVNNSAKALLTNGGTQIASGLTDAEVKRVATPGTYVMATAYSDTQLLVMSANGTLSLLTF